MRYLLFYKAIIQRNREGSSTLELVIAMPALVMLLIGMAMVLGLGLKSYLYSLSDWQMVDEMRFATQIIAKKVRYANKVAVSGNNSTTLTLYMYDSSGLSKATYSLKSKKIVWNNNQPITGDSMLGYVDIINLKFISGVNYVEMQIRARNELTGYIYDVDTKIYTLGVLKG